MDGRTDGRQAHRYIPPKLSVGDKNVSMHACTKTRVYLANLWSYLRSEGGMGSGMLSQGKNLEVLEWTSHYLSNRKHEVFIGSPITSAVLAFF